MQVYLPWIIDDHKTSVKFSLRYTGLVSYLMENLMNSFNRVALMASLTTALFLGACSSTPVAAPAAPAAPAPAVVEAAPAPAAPKAVSTESSVKQVLPPYLDPANPLSTTRSVYFDFDKSAVKPEGMGVLELHGKYLAANPGLSIKVEGNADERGGAEYNLALGQKRAEAVVKVLKTFGVKDTQLEAVSYGKEKPKALGHDEKSYAENRRGDLAYPTK